ncbi:glycosyltransferase family 4 protein [Halomonas organivorans]
MKIAHVNLAKGFRGGERQTALLIEALASRPHLQQTLVCRKDSPLRDALASVPGLRVVEAAHQLAGHARTGRVDLVHAHEAKAVHWAALHRIATASAYVITRRVDAQVKDKWVNRLTYRHAASRVAISSIIHRQLAARGWGEVDCVPSAHSEPTTDARETSAFRRRFDGKFLIGHAGALVDRHKGQRVLIEAARRLQHEAPEMQFVFLGQGEDAEALQTASADLDNVSWLGFKDNIADYLAGLDVFAFPSRNEGLGSVLLDVMHLGVPIVASEAGGIPDIVEPERTGLLVPVGDATALAEALLRLKGDAGLRARLADTASERLERFSPARMAEAYLGLYERTLRGST